MNEPFEGDTYIPKDIQDLVDHLGLTRCVETGTQYGSTTIALAEIFDWVETIEADKEFLRIAFTRKPQNATMYEGLSTERLKQLVKDNTLYYLDAHGCAIGGCPLKEELEILAQEQPRNIAIAIHDFKVPGKDFGYDTYDYPLEWSEIEPIVKRIFKNPVHYYNEQANGAYRGIVYIHEATS